MCVCVHADVGLCVINMHELIINKTQDRHTPGVGACTDIDGFVYDKKPVKKRQSKCRDKEWGPTRRNGMKNCLTETG